jgi:hypothetical protein
VSLRKRKKEKLEHGCCIRWRECALREPFPQSSNNTNNYTFATAVFYIEI